MLSGPDTHSSSSPSSSPTDPHLLPIHRGAIDRTTITTSPPAQVMHRVTTLLLRMGVRVTAESAFRLRCVRPSSWESEGGEERVEGDGSVGEEYNEEEVDEEDEVENSSSSGSDTETEASSSGAHKATHRAAKAIPTSRARARIQVHRISDPQADQAPTLNPQNSQSAPDPTSLPQTPSKFPSNSNSPIKCTLYGPTPSSDPAHEVRFSVELTQLAGLPGTYSLDIRRLKGHLRSYKYVYDTLRDRAELNRPVPA